MDLNVHLGLDPDTLDALSRRIASLVITALQPILQQEHTIMAAIDDQLATLTTAVAAEGTAVASAVTLLGGVQKMISDAVAAALEAGATPAQLQAITDANTAIAAQTASLSAAVAADTPTPPAGNAAPAA